MSATRHAFARPRYTRVAPANFTVANVSHALGTALLCAIQAYRTRETTSVENYGLHFTTWSWTVLCIWASAALAGMLSTRKAFDTVVAVAYFFALGNVWQVYVVFSAIVLANGDALLRFMDGNVTFGQLWAGEKVTHALPVLFMLCYSVAHWDRLREAVLRWRDRTRKHPLTWAALCAYWLLSPVALIGIYSMSHDPWEVYRSTLPFGVLAVIATCACLVASGIPLLAFLMSKRCTDTDARDLTK